MTKERADVSEVEAKIEGESQKICSPSSSSCPFGTSIIFLSEDE